MEYKIFDKNYLEIENGDLLKVYHFTAYNRRKHYMYHVAVFDEEKGCIRFRDYNSNEPHYIIIDKSTYHLDPNNRYVNAEIIYKPNWKNEDTLIKEAKKCKNINQ